MRISDVKSLWHPAGVYCNTASYGLPPQPAWDALQTALDEWHGGRTSWEHWGEATEGSRAAFARLVGVDVDLHRKTDLQRMLRENLVAERIVISSYQEIIRWIGNNDPTTRRLMESILAEEEEHADDLTDLLGK